MCCRSTGRCEISVRRESRRSPFILRWPQDVARSRSARSNADFGLLLRAIPPPPSLLCIPVAATARLLSIVAVGGRIPTVISGRYWYLGRILASILIGYRYLGGY
ncbi:hypothetical protein L484_019116 [Morus notabilis]|uniref:Uncharacterized protein n=1 Tax=Morus notabilis TaxID=981085 RepID=W9SBH5_9ROSA|nr:hypothetical protein L484_019116 [Morus notabilis]